MAMITRRRWLAATGALLVGGAWSTSRADEQVVQLIARKFAFEPERITVKRGAPVVLQLRSKDILMGISAPDLGIRADMLPDRFTEARFTPRKTGTFIILCDVFCGDDHDSMSGEIVVVA
jgi:cytochrome c oxidase subunit II